MLRDIANRLRAIVRRSEVESDLDAELRYHFDRQVEHFIAQGESREAALRRARLQLGSLDQMKEACRDERGIGWWETFTRETRHAVRALAKRPGFALGVVGMLCLGIGGNLALFSVFNGLFLKPLPIDQPEQVVDLDEVAPAWNLEYTGVRYSDFHEWRAHNTSFESMACYSGGDVNGLVNGETRRLRAIEVTHDLPALMRIRPALGRFFSEAEDRPNANRVAMISYDLWQQQYGGQASVLGQGIMLNGRGAEIIGVLPAGLRMPREADVWGPLGLSPTQPAGWFLNGLGRLKPGVTVSQALTDLTRIHKGIRDDANKITSPRISSIVERQFGDLRSYSAIVLAGVGIVLLIACVNIAGLMLVRAQARRHEMAIRAALGASRWQLGRQWMAESLLLALGGGVAGLALGLAGLRLLIGLVPENTLPSWVSFTIDWRFAAFALAITSFSALLFGLVPGWRASRAGVRSEMAESATRSSASAGQRNGLNALVVAEVALAALLLVTAALLGKGFWQLMQIDPGFRTDNVLAYTIALPNSKYDKPERRAEFYERLLERTRALPGVRDAAAASFTPLAGHNGNFFMAEGAAPRASGEQDPVILNQVVTPGYLRTMGVQLVEGRDFLPGEADPKNTPVLVNETFARQHWGKGSAIGRRISYRGRAPNWMPVVGVVKDWRHYGLDKDIRPAVLLPHRFASRGQMTVVMRTSGDPLALTSAARQAVRELDPELPMFQIMSMEERLHRSLWIRRTYSWLLGLFAGIALVLAVAGLYGVVSYTVAQRQREIGIRLALGATPGIVGREILTQGLRLVLMGLAAGLTTSYFAARWLGTLLKGVVASDPWIYGTVLLLLLGVAVLANAWPARRAGRLDPVRALRCE